MTAEAITQITIRICIQIQKGLIYASSQVSGSRSTP
jgi:hypothetical protein